MELKFNNGRGAVLCERCGVIIMEDFTLKQWEALKRLAKLNVKWYCGECKDETPD